MVCSILSLITSFLALVGLIVLLALLCQVQTYQYRHWQIHWSDMDKERYWENFLRIDKALK